MQNLLDPAILFFVFGILAGTVKSNLEIPPAISRFLSLYLLMALGLKGGFALAHSGLTVQVGAGLAAAVGLALVIPMIGYTLLKRFLSGFDAAAIAATYGSVSAVTFVTTVQHLENQQIAYGGHMAAAMALMESPAIIMAVLMASALRRRSNAQHGTATAQASALAVGSGASGWAGACMTSWRITWCTSGAVAAPDAIASSAAARPARGWRSTTSRGSANPATTKSVAAARCPFSTSSRTWR